MSSRMSGPHIWDHGSHRRVIARTDDAAPSHSCSGASAPLPRSLARIAAMISLSFRAQASQVEVVKIFCIGLNKTGTISLHEALTTLGFSSLHWGGQASRLAVEQAIREDTPLLEYLGDY